jgi:hypothetical protein
VSSFRLPPGTAPSKYIKRWQKDAEGNLLDFNLKDSRLDLVARLQSGRLYTLQECKVMLRHILQCITNVGQRDFNHILFLNEFRLHVCPEKVRLSPTHTYVCDLFFG